MGAEVEECPVMVPLRPPLLLPSKTGQREVNLWAQPSLLDSALITAKITPGRSSTKLEDHSVCLFFVECLILTLFFIMSSSSSTFSSSSF